MGGLVTWRRWVFLLLVGPWASAAPVAMRLEGATLRFTFGLKDEAPTAWDGALEVAQGRVAALSPQYPRITTIQANTWKVRSVQQRGPRPKQTRIIRPVVTATLEAAATATVSLTTPQGKASFALRDLQFATPLTLLDGQVRVERFPLAVPLTAEPTEDDWPAAAPGRNGAIWVAYVAYTHGSPIDARAAHDQREFGSLVTRGHGDRVRLLGFDGGGWDFPIDVTEAGLDVWRPAVAVDGQGMVWVVWSQSVDGNWDLYARVYHPATRMWLPTKQLTTAPGADAYAVAATHPRTGAAHIAWQGWRDGSFDILTKALDARRPTAEERLAQSPANEWSPQIAFDSKGTLHVAFDTYERGQYDVRLASVADGQAPRVVDVAASAQFEARPSLVVDRADRVWVAYERAGLNWAKDYGSQWPGPSGERLYLWREVAVRCVVGGRVLEPKGVVPAEAVMASYPRGTMKARRRFSLPRLGIDGAGRAWLLYRRNATTRTSSETWVSYATYHTGEGWAPPVQLANATNLLDNRPALAPLPSGGLAAIHSTDWRTRGTPSGKQNDLHCSVLTAEGDAQPPTLAEPPQVKYKFALVHPTEADDVRRLRAWRIQAGGKTYQLLRGEFHRHTELTSHQDMDGPLEEMWRYGLDAAAMDWIGNGDHDNGYGREYLWWLVQKQTDIFHHPPHFLPMFTYERSVSFPSGHRNAMFARRGIRPLPRIGGGRERLMGTPEQGSPDIKTFYAYLKHFGGLCASHTSGTGMGTDWRDNDPDVEPVVEIYQGCRQSYEHEGAPAAMSDSQATRAIGGYRPAGFIWNALMKGYRLGFESSSDHYSTHISYAVVLAEAPTREAILDGFQRRHCYAAHDNIILDVRCGERLMGDLFDLEGKPALSIKAIGTRPIARVSVIRGVGSDKPVYVYNAEPNRKEVELTWTDQSPAWGQRAYYYVRIEQERPEGGFGALAWASPMWITAEE